MGLLTCSQCGLQKEGTSDSSCCPMCGGKLVIPTEVLFEEPIREKQENLVKEIDVFVSIEDFRAKLLQIAEPACEDDAYLNDVARKIEHYLIQVTRKLPKEIFLYIRESSFSAINELLAHKAWRADKAYEQSEAYKKASSEYRAAMSNGPGESSGLGFSIITNNAVDAATYVALSAHEEKKKKLKHEQDALDKFNQELTALNKRSVGNGSRYGLTKMIDNIVHEFSFLYNAYQFVKENADFYEDPEKYDVGITIDGLNLYELLKCATESSSGFIGECSSLPVEMRKQNLECILPRLEQLGYIKYFKLITRKYERVGKEKIPTEIIKDGKFITTGKYENTVRQKQLSSTDQEETEAKEKAIEKQNAEQYSMAEDAYNSGRYYEAAIGFGKLDGYRDSLKRSLSIWHDKILSNNFDGMDSAWGVTVDGSVYKKEGFDSAKRMEIFESKGIKQICCLDWNWNCWIALGWDGRVKTYFHYEKSSDELKWDPIKKLEKSCKKIAALYPKYNLGYSYLVCLFEDGTVQFFGQLSDGTNVGEKLSHWQNIDRIVHGSISIVGIRKDGTIVAAGNAERFENTIRTWENIADVTIVTLYSGKYGKDFDTLFSLTSDGRVLAVGENEEWCDKIYSWRNIKSFVYFKSHFSSFLTLIGLHDTGTVLWGSSMMPQDSDDADVYGRIVGQKGIVQLIYYFGYIYALKADGTVITTDKRVDISHWKDIVCVDGSYAITADGKFVFDSKTSERTVQSLSKIKLFKHIDTFAEERKCAMTQRAVFGGTTNVSSNPTASSNSGGCYIATAVYGSYDCPEVWTLRRFRDDILAKTWYGRLFIHTYYAVSPSLVKWLGHTSWFQNHWKRKLDRMVADLNASGIESTPYIDRSW